MILLLGKKKLINWFEALHVRTGNRSKGFHMGIEWVVGRTSTTYNSTNGETYNIITFYLRDEKGWSNHMTLTLGNMRQVGSLAPYIEKYIDDSIYLSNNNFSIIDYANILSR